MKKFLIIFLGLLFCPLSQIFAQTLTATVNRQEVPQGELVVLSLNYDGKHTNEKPDLRVLQKNFNIFSMEQEFQNVYENGKSKQTQSWHIGLMPKSKGKLSIPAIPLGTLYSQPLEINVVPASLNSSSSEQDNIPKYAIKTEIDNPNPFVQQEVNLTVTLYDAGGLQGGAPYFSEQAQQDWNILALGEPDLESKVINGKSVRLIKFNYALFPQKSGKLTIPQVQFDGYYLTRNKSSDPFQRIFDSHFGNVGLSITDLSATRNPVVLVTDPIEVNVKPALTNSQWWIPAEKLEIFSQWQPSPPVFKIGEAVNRDITIQALGVSDKQLPTLHFENSSAMKQYPEKPSSENKIKNGKVAAVKNIRNVYIPTKEGKQIIPEVKIDWYNVTTGKTEVAILPAMEITVQPGLMPQTINSTVDDNVKQENKTSSMNSQPQNAVVEEAPVSEPPSQSMNIFLWSIISFFGGSFVCYLLFTFSKKSKQNSSSNSQNYYAEVIKFAKEKDFRALRDCLIFWARNKYHDENINNFHDIYRYNSDFDFHKELDILSATLYAQQKDEWDDKKFIDVFIKTNKQNKHIANEEQPLPDLYK